MKFIEIDEKVYYVINCSKCNSELKFHLDKNERETFGACAKCGHSFSLMVPSLKDYKKNKK